MGKFFSFFFFWRLNLVLLSTLTSYSISQFCSKNSLQIQNELIQKKWLTSNISTVRNKTKIFIPYKGCARFKSLSLYKFKSTCYLLKTISKRQKTRTTQWKTHEEEVQWIRKTFGWRIFQDYFIILLTSYFSVMMSLIFIQIWAITVSSVSTELLIASESITTHLKAIE